MCDCDVASLVWFIVFENLFIFFALGMTCNIIWERVMEIKALLEKDGE